MEGYTHLSCYFCAVMKHKAQKLNTTLPITAPPNVSSQTQHLPFQRQGCTPCCFIWQIHQRMALEPVTTGSVVFAYVALKRYLSTSPDVENTTEDGTQPQRHHEVSLEFRIRNSNSEVAEPVYPSHQPRHESHLVQINPCRCLPHDHRQSGLRPSLLRFHESHVFTFPQTSPRLSQLAIVDCQSPGCTSVV